MTLEFPDASRALPVLLNRVLTEGHLTDSRNGRTRELTMQHITLTDPGEFYITTAGRKASLPAQIAETMWLLAGRNDIEWLSHYLPRAAEFSDDGQTWRGAYGPRLRAWEHGSAEVDQLAHVVRLLQEDPNTRRAVLAIYNPTIDTHPGKDIPCNNWLHLLPRNGVLHGHVAIRSNDLMWGWSGINAFEWTVLLTVVAGLTGLQRGSLTFSISSLHLYEHHWEKAADIVERADFDPEFLKDSPTFKLPNNSDLDAVSLLDGLVDRWFKVEALIRSEDATERQIMQAINAFQEPMLQSWLWVLYAWQTGDMDILSMMGLEGTALYAAAVDSPPRVKPVVIPEYPFDRDGFRQFAVRLHTEKNAVYGTSWKRRGEMLGIMANIARKVDRLGVAGAGDTSADTAVDLLLYLVKYHLWLEEERVNLEGGSSISYTDGEEHVARVNSFMDHLEHHGGELKGTLTEHLIAGITDGFNRLEQLVMEKRSDRVDHVEQLIQLAYPLAVRLWTEENQAFSTLPPLQPAAVGNSNPWI